MVDFFDARRVHLHCVKANFAHEYFVQLKEKWGKYLFILTLIVDDLLVRAGCRDVVHLLGFLAELRCFSCDDIFFIGYE